MTAGNPDGRSGRPSQLKRAFGELIVVGGASLAMIFWIIPAETTSGGALGLSPQLAPTVCSAAIGILSLIQFVAKLVSTPKAAEAKPDGDAPIRYALLVIVATVLGIAAIAYIGWPLGAACLAFLVLVALGERRPLMLTVLPGAVVALLFLVLETGV